MARKLGMLGGKVYGYRISYYGQEHGHLDYKTMADIVGDMVLANGIIRTTWDTCEWELENGSDYDEENDSYTDIYQEYIISERGAAWLKEHTDEIVYYSPALDISVWGITHWGTGWDYVLSNIELVECETFGDLCAFNEKMREEQEDAA